MPARKRKSIDVTKTTSSKTKRNIVKNDNKSIRDCCSTADDDKLLLKECLSVRYALALWASECFEQSKERMKSEECLIRESMRERLQSAIENAEKEHRLKSGEQGKVLDNRNTTQHKHSTTNNNNNTDNTDKLNYQTLDAAFNAEIIERVLFWRWYFLQPAMYRQRCRQLEYSLSTNGWYLLTRFSPLTICSFPTTKLAEGTALDEWRQENRNRVLRRLKPPTPVIREKSMFPCVKCKSNNTTYYPLQTRGADEPMTNFVTCHDCDTRFRRS